jgi:hypothetical protein
LNRILNRRATPASTLIGNFQQPASVVLLNTPPAAERPREGSQTWKVWTRGIYEYIYRVEDAVRIAFCAHLQCADSEDFWPRRSTSGYLLSALKISGPDVPRLATFSPPLRGQ